MNVLLLVYYHTTHNADFTMATKTVEIKDLTLEQTNSLIKQTTDGENGVSGHQKKTTKINNDNSKAMVIILSLTNQYSDAENVLRAGQEKLKNLQEKLEAESDVNTKEAIETEIKSTQDKFNQTLKHYQKLTDQLFNGRKNLVDNQNAMIEGQNCIIECLSTIVVLTQHRESLTEIANEQALEAVAQKTLEVEETSLVEVIGETSSSE